MIKNENYMVIQGWMRTKLGLKGNELLVYAMIYGFSQDGISSFRGTVDYMSEWIGCSKVTIYRVLESLAEKNLIVKQTDSVHGIALPPTYYIKKEALFQNENDSFKMKQGVSKCNSEFQNETDVFQNETDVFQNETHINNNIYIDNYKERKNERKKPTLDEIRAYCEERKNGIDPERFYDYHEQSGWKLANGNPVKDWKAAVRTWEKKQKEYNSEKKQNEKQNKFNNFEQRDYNFSSLEKQLLGYP